MVAGEPSMIPESLTDSVPMRETVKRGIMLLSAEFNRNFAEYVHHALTEAGMDPAAWQPNVATFTFERVKKDGGA